MHRVVVTGIGVVSPNGIGRREFSEAIVEGRSGVSYIESFDTSGLTIKIAGEVKNFDVLPYLGEHKKNAEADEPGGAVRRGRRGHGGRGLGPRDRAARPGAVRRLHGDGDHAGGRRRAGRLRSARASGTDGRSTWAGSPRPGPSRSSRSGCCSICRTWPRPTSRSSTTRWGRTTRS